MPTLPLSRKLEELLRKEWARIDRLSAKAIASAATPTVDELMRAHEVFFEREKRDIYYRAALSLLAPAREVQVDLSPTDVLLLLLLTWNKSYYRYHPLTDTHYAAIEKLLVEFQAQLSVSKDRDLSSCDEGFHTDEGWVWTMFVSFKEVLGPVGAAKALHLLAPHFFPLWDSSIAKKAYRVPQDAGGYIAMMRAVKHQYNNLDRPLPINQNYLKFIDEYNYSRYRTGWI